MDFVARIIEWCENLLYGASDLTHWLVTPFNFVGDSITPLELVSVGGLMLFVGVAIVKWVISL